MSSRNDEQMLNSDIFALLQVGDNPTENEIKTVSVYFYYLLKKCFIFKQVLC